MQKGFTPIFIFLGIGILVLLVPIPEYKEFTTACPAVYETNAKCFSEKKWIIGKPLIWRMILKITLKPPVQTSSLIATPTPSPNETVYTEASRSANWKTYTNKKHGIQFSYPSNLKPGKYTSDNGILLIADFSDDQNNDLQVWTALNGGVGRGGDFSMKQLSNDTKVKVANYDATLTISETDPSSSFYSAEDPILRRYSVVLDNKPVIIEFTGMRASLSIDQLNQILSTFRFD